MIFKKKSYLLICVLHFLVNLCSCEYNYDFIFNNFHDYFSPKLKFVHIPNKNEMKIVCSEKIYPNDLIFSIPFEKIINPTNSYRHQAEINQIIKSFHVDENLGDTVSMIIFILTKKFQEKNDGQNENKNFLYEYFSSINSERDTILWWDKKDLEFVKKSLYYFNDVWVENMIKETDSAIALTKQIFQDFQKKHVRNSFF